METTNAIATATDDRTAILVKSGLNWRVRSETLTTSSGIIVPETLALVREDTNTVLGINGDGYQPYQNEELLDLLYKISNQTGLQVHTGGSFKGGQKVFFQLKSNDLVINNDKIEGYISGLNSFDGSTALAFGTSSTTISCMNTFWRTYRQVNTKLRHSSLMKPRIEEILCKIDLLLNEEQEQFKEIEKLGNITMSAEVRELVTRKLFEISVEEKLDSNELSTRTKNNLFRFNADLTMELAQKGDNLWGLFNGVTRYTTHSMKKTDNTEAKMFGKTGNIERKIYADLLEMLQ